MPKALAAMLFGTAYLAAIIAFSGVVYLRGLALVYADIIQYPILLGAMAVLACLLVPLSRTGLPQAPRLQSQRRSCQVIRPIISPLNSAAALFLSLIRKCRRPLGFCCRRQTRSGSGRRF